MITIARAAPARSAGGPLPVFSVWPCAGSARTPRSLPNRPGEAVSPCGRMGHGVQRRQRRDGQAAGPAAGRWSVAATSAAGQIEKPTCSASLSSSRLEPARWPIGGACYRIELCISGVAAARLAHSRACLIVLAALPAARRANHHAGGAGGRGRWRAARTRSAAPLTAAGTSGSSKGCSGPETPLAFGVTGGRPAPGAGAGRGQGWRLRFGGSRPSSAARRTAARRLVTASLA